MMPILGLRVTGRVQGVGFRWWVQKEGLRAGVAGRVWNCPDGTVRVDLQGPAAHLEAFRHRLKEGPPLAVVQSVSVVEPDRETELEGFQIVTDLGRD